MYWADLHDSPDGLKVLVNILGQSKWLIEIGLLFPTLHYACVKTGPLQGNTPQAQEAPLQTCNQMGLLCLKRIFFRTLVKRL